MGNPLVNCAKAATLVGTELSLHVREIVGYLFGLLALGLLFGGAWAAIHFSPGRSYSRMRRAERRAQRTKRS